MRASRGEARLDSQTGSPKGWPSASSPLGPVRRVGGSIGDWCTHQFANGRFLELGTPLSEVRVRDREGLPWADEKALLDTLALSRLFNRQIHDLHAGANSSAATDEFGKTLYGHESSDRVIVEAVASIAAARGVSRAQIALAWVSRNPVVSAPIVGARKPAHLDDALASLDIVLTQDEVAQLETPYTPHPVAVF